MYVNMDRPADFNPHTCYAFLRRHGDEVLLVAVNFSDQARTQKIAIPELAIGMYGIKEGTKQCVELISGDKARKTVSASRPFDVDLGPWGAAVWKFKAAAACGVKARATK